MSSSIDRLEQEIRQSIGYDRLVSSIDATGGVALAWPDLRQSFAQNERGWTLEADQVEFTGQPGLVARTYVFRKGEGQLDIDVFVSSRGPAPALRRLVDTLAATSIGYRRYQPGPADIGQLCLVLPLTNPTVLVINHNVYLSLRLSDGSMDIVALARELTKLMDAHRVPVLAVKAPAFAALSAAPSTARVGESVKIAVGLPTAFAADQLLWSLSYEIEAGVVDERGRGTDYLELRIMQPGRIEVPLWLADRRTLLSSESRVGIDVRP